MSPVFSSIVMHPTPQPVSANGFAGCPCPFPVIVRVKIRPVVERYRVVVGPSRNSTPVMGSSDSKTVLCLAPLSCIKSPLTTVTDPLANPIASWERSSSAANADICYIQLLTAQIVKVRHTGNCLLPFWISSVDKHFGAPVFFSILSKAQTLSTGSFDRSSDMVTSSAVPSTCFMWVIDPPSYAWKVRTTLKACESIRTEPSLPPRKRLSDPEHTQLRSLLLQD